MVFNSAAFFLFFPLVWVLYWFAFNRNLRLQNLLIVVASCVFYGWWDSRFLGLLSLSAGIDFLTAIKITQTENPRLRKMWLGVSLITNLGLLFFFKYFHFFGESLILALQPLGITLDRITVKIILPVGISFYTFQTLSYTIDVYQRKINVTRDFIAFMAFISFFPQLVAGPIERAANLLPQFLRPRQFSSQQAVSGLRRILWGFFKKVVIADGVAIWVDTCYHQPETYSGIVLAFATIAFAIQIYCDFSGYSDIAVGVSQLMGVRLMENFYTPYFATSLQDFWRRWHISLSTWFKDYVYIPMGGNRRLPYRNLMITFLLSGLWHGANWTYLIWGGIHGIALCIELFIASFSVHFSLPRWLQRGITLSVVCLAWVFFRADSLATSMAILHKIASSSLFYIEDIFTVIPRISGGTLPFLYLLSMLGVFIGVEHLLQTDSIDKIMEKYTRPARWGFYYLMIMFIILFGTYNHAPTFIYFQF